ncbi:MAG: kelch repeat-containing protein [Verrucomicrobia bacterium]|nr:kelch repeat-containing protein [Verrucomicrobiota bacterium]
MALLGLATTAVLSGAAGWVELDALPQAVAGQAAAVRGETLWVAGGSRWEGGTKHIEDTVRRKASNGTTWETVATIPGGFAHGGWADDGQALWLVGGLDRRGVSRAVWRIDLADGTVSVAAKLSEPRAYGGAAVLDGALWVVGGTAVDGDFFHASTTVCRMDLTTHAVRAVEAPGPAFINPLVLALHGELHVLPGGVWSAERRVLEPPTEAWVFLPRANAWSRRPLGVVLPRGLSGVALDAERALIAGGVERRGGAATIATGTWIYDARTGELAPQTPLPAPRLAAAMVRAGAGVVLLGGEDGPRQRVATVWRLATGDEGGK